MTRAAFDATWQRILDAGMIGGIEEGLKVLLGEVGLPMMVGGSILGVLLAVPLYPLTYRAVVAHRRRRDARLAYERLRELRSIAPIDPLRPPYGPSDTGEDFPPTVDPPEIQREESVL